MEQYERLKLLIGEEGLNKLKNSHVAVFGVGGVGGYVCEALVRSGIGQIDLIDHDTVSESNLNRQIIALHSTIGKLKVDVLKERLLDIDPKVKVNTYPVFFLPENADDFDFAGYDYVIDAVDTVTAKIEIILKAKEYNVPVISSMGTGNKLDPSRLEVSDIYKTEMCPLAKVMRKEMKKRGVKKLKVVYSREKPIDVDCSNMKLPEGKRSIPGSTAFVPPAAGLLIASEVVKDLIR